MTWGGVAKPPVMPTGVRVHGPAPLGLLERDINLCSLGRWLTRYLCSLGAIA